ncbi:hypothetical protein NW752_004543 [Fusarium irregulare]|uniref:Uncharacterized protein n=1 Tax=Fusarium irregulare TaxID=2494466 RepID=A0A9W8PMU2_9HYPO|nr:hypothetical protein LB507_005842 [Fusarium sp. FIESC RH6]KAJ4012149.1 hypothetical protein NW766_007450 [Fusarium irregulare]KAJ4021535.1 hypothetical protein NW752_004543 [Fusarium irregulare]
MPSNATIPSPEYRETITARFADLISAIESHSSWTPPNVDRSLFHVWDFVKRSHYIMTELDNIAAGRPVQHPEQIPKNNGNNSGPQAAASSFHDVLTRTIMINQTIQDPRMLVMMGMSNLDFGPTIKEKSEAVVEALNNSS